MSEQIFSKAIRIDPNPKATWQASAASARVVFILSASRTPPLMEEIKNGNDRVYLRIERGYLFQQNSTRVMPLAQSERFQGRWNYSSGTRGNQPRRDGRFSFCEFLILSSRC